jgi:hypothetical protein
MSSSTDTTISPLKKAQATLPSDFYVALRKNNSIVTLKNEISERVFLNQKQGNAISLVHDVLHIGMEPGMGEPAAAAELLLQESSIAWNVVRLKSKSEKKRPVILDCLSWSKTIAAGRKTGIVPPRNVVISTVMNLCTIVMSLAVSLIPFLLKDIRSGTAVTGGAILAIVESGAFIGIAICVIALGLWLRHSITRFADSRNRNIEETLTAYTKGFTGTGDGRELFINEIRDLVFNRPMPIALIIDDLQAIDPFSKAALHEIVTADPTRYIGLVIWIIFDTDEPAGFTSLFGKKADKNAGTIRYQEYVLEKARVMKKP